ncbi:hypothetical protein [Pedobacter sp.]|uniref:hypothetical protein n=1 Tax=Pedobacter sp. TaxID=1411316 RepID=UPI0031D1CCFF
MAETAKPTNDVTALANYAGKYSKALIGQLLNTLDIATDIFVMRNIDGPTKLTKLTISAGIRPIDTSIDDVDDTGRVWSGRTIDVYGGMKLFKVIPEELRKTWMSDQLGPNAKKEPFAQFTWTKEFEKIAEEINDSVFYADYKADAPAYDALAVYTAGVSFVKFEKNFYACITTTTAGQSPTTHPAKWEKINASAITTGLGTIIKNEITAGNLVPIPTAVFTETNTVAELQKVWEGTSKAFKKKKSIMYISGDVMTKYLKDYDTRYGKGNGIADTTEDDPIVYLKGSRKKVLLKECTWMNDSQRVFITLDENAVMAINQDSDLNSIGKMIETLHGYKAIIKYLMGFQFQDLEILYVNDKL